VRTWSYLVAAIVSEVSATLALRAATDHPGWIALVVSGYLASFVLLAAVLRRGMAIGVAYGVWSACGVLLTALAAAVLFAEPLNQVMGVGLGAIAVGVLLIERGGRGEGAGRPAVSDDGGRRTS
jgi:small multidrug resistance pump